jgi:hypothetical protein
MGLFSAARSIGFGEEEEEEEGGRRVCPLCARVRDAGLGSVDGDVVVVRLLLL